MSIYSSSAMMPPTYLPHGQMMQLLAPSPDQTAAAVVAAAAAAAAGQQVRVRLFRVRLGWARFG